MRLSSLLIAAFLGVTSSSSAVQIVNTQFTVTAEARQGFRLLAWLMLAPEFPKDKRVVVAELNCSEANAGMLRFRALNIQDAVQGDEADQAAVAVAIYANKQLKVGKLTASCLEGKLKVNTPSAAALRSAFPDRSLPADQVATERALGVSQEVTFSASGARLMRVPFAFQNGVLSAPERASGLAMGVTQGGILKPVANGLTSTPVVVKISQPYTLHVIAGMWFNMTVNGGQLTAWVSRKP